MFTLGIKKEFGTYHPDTIYDEDGKAICLVYGIASNWTLEQMDERDAKGLEMARRIVDALNFMESFTAPLIAKCLFGNEHEYHTVTNGTYTKTVCGKCGNRKQEQ